MLKLVNLRKEFRAGNTSQTAVKDLSCEINQHEFVVLVGRSGSGKSTLLNLMGGIEVPEQGEVFFEGQSFSKMSDQEISAIRLQKIGFIFQTFNLIPVLSAFENVEYPLLYLNMPSEQRKDLTRDILKKVGLEKHHNSKPSQLSGGQRQRVAIARALVKSPSLVLADEPTANLDLQTSKEIIHLMENLFSEKKSTIIFCTHDEEQVTQGTRWLEMGDGVLLKDRRKA